MFKKCQEDEIVFVDCPGFSDDRGDEIEISNFVNIQNIITNGKSVRLIIMISYS